MKRYACLYQNSVGSHWCEDFRSVREFRAWLVANPDTVWAVLVLSSSARVVETFHRKPPRGRPEPPGDVKTFV